MQNVAKSIGDTVKRKAKAFQENRKTARIERAKRAEVKRQERERSKREAEEAERKKKEAEEAEAKRQEAAAREAEKQDVINSGDIDRVLKNQSVLTPQELQAAIDRINLNKQLKDMQVDKVTEGVNKISNIMNNAAKVGDAVEKGITTWNTFAKVANNLTKASFPIIDDKFAKAKSDAAKLSKYLTKEDGIDEILKDTSKFTTAQLKDAAARKAAIDNLKDLSEADKKKAEEDSKDTSPKNQNDSKAEAKANKAADKEAEKQRKTEEKAKKEADREADKQRKAEEKAKKDAEAKEAAKKKEYEKELTKQARENAKQIAEAAKKAKEAADKKAKEEEELRREEMLSRKREAEKQYKEAERIKKESKAIEKQLKKDEERQRQLDRDAEAAKRIQSYLDSAYEKFDQIKADGPSRWDNYRYEKLMDSSKEIIDKLKKY